MPYSNLALSIQHHPIRLRHLSLQENSRLARTSLEAFHHVLEVARLSTQPTESHLAVLKLPLNDEHLSHLAWQTTLLSTDYTTVLAPIPHQFFRLLAPDQETPTSTTSTTLPACQTSSNAGVTLYPNHNRVLPPITQQFNLLAPGINPLTSHTSTTLIASRISGNASVTLYLDLSAPSLTTASCEWMGGTRAENENLQTAPTVPRLHHTPTSSHVQNATRTRVTREWPHVFTDWIDATLSEFAAESNKSAFVRGYAAEVWDRAVDMVRAEEDARNAWVGASMSVELNCRRQRQPVWDDDDCENSE